MWVIETRLRSNKKRRVMKTIYRFDLPTKDLVEVVARKGARLLPYVASSDRERGGFTAWAIVDTEEPTANYLLRVYGTGHSLPDDTGTYLGTYTVPAYGGPLVFHVFADVIPDA